MSMRLKLILLLVLWSPILPSRANADEPDAAPRIAAGTARALVENRLTEIASSFRPELLSAVPVARVQEAWQAMLRKTGAVLSIGAPHVQAVIRPRTFAVVVPVHCDRHDVDLLLSIEDGKIGGISFELAETTRWQSWKRPGYADPSKFADSEVEIGRDPWKLPGTLTVPIGAGKSPAVILVHGSGPHDRNESVGPNRPFEDLAEGLATRGIAVLRYEKRTRAHQAQMAALKSFTVKEDVTDDAAAAIDYLRSLPEIDPKRIVVAGHSLGAMLAPRIAKERPDLAAIVMLAPLARRLQDDIIDELEYLAQRNGPPDDVTESRLEAARLEAAKATAARADDPGGLIFGVPPAYFADLNTYDPVASAAELRLPTLILQGGRDYQVTKADFLQYQGVLASHPNVTIREFPRLDHLFMAGDAPSTPNDYLKPGHVDDAVIGAIADFVHGLPG